MAGEAKYIYCIVDGNPPVSIGQNGIHTVVYRDLAAVVRDVPLPAGKPSREDLVDHLRVIEQVMSTNTVIPVEFGTIADDEEEVRKELLANRYEQLSDLLGYLDEKAELGLKVLWRELQVIFSEIVAEQEKIRALREWIAARSEMHTRQERIEVGRMVAEALEAKRSAESEALLKVLAPLAVEARAGGLMGEKMILNAAFLVERKREGEFDAAVSRLGEELSQRLLFKYVGPIPPFNFVSLQ